MKNSRRLLVCVLTIFSALFLAGAVNATGPVSKLFLTAGDENTIWVVQGSSVVNSWTEHNLHEHGIAVFNTVRTLGDASGSFGSEYTPAGLFTGVTYPYPLGPGTNMYDGTTDTTLNYSVDFDTGNVYSFNSNWTSPSLLFSEALGFLGITYDPTDNTLWLSNFGGTIVEHRSLFGTLISSFTVPFTSITFLALDPADGTLWMGSQNTQGTFYQYSKTGSQLSTVTYPALVSQNTLGGEFQAIATDTDQLEVNGQGTIVGPSGKKVSFAFLDVENEQVTKQYLEGVLAYQDKGSQDSFQTGKITSVIASGNEAVISGTATIGGKHKQTVNFTIKVTGNQNPATNDTFSVSLSNGYNASGKLTSGFISVQPGD